MKKILVIGLLFFSVSSAFAQWEVSINDSSATSSTVRGQYKVFNSIPYLIIKGQPAIRLGLKSEITAAANGGVQTVNSIAPTSGNVNITFSNLLSKPTTISGFGITDAVVTSGTYSNPAWITAIAAAKVTGLATVGTTGLFADLGSKPTTVAGYGITDAVTTGGSYTNPAWLVSIPFSKISSPPTTLAGYGITDAATTAATVPYKTVATYSALLSESAPAAGFIKFVMVQTDSQYSESSSVYIVTPAGKIRKFGLLPSEN